MSKYISILRTIFREILFFYGIIFTDTKERNDFYGTNGIIRLGTEK